MQKITITIPQQYNDGKLISIKIMEQIESDLLNLFGGYSRYGIAGAWSEHDNKGNVCRTYRDFSYRYEILTDMHYDILRDYARTLCTILDQKCILTTCENINVDFIKK